MASTCRSHHVCIRGSFALLALCMSLSMSLGACAVRSQRYQDLSADLGALDQRAGEGPASSVPQTGTEPLFTSPTLELPPLVRAVLERNPSLDAAAAAWRAALAQYPQSTALPDPMVGYSIAPLSVRSEAPFGHMLEVSQELPWPGKRRLEGEVMLAEAAMAAADYRAVRLRLALMAVQLFYDYYAASRAIDALQRYLAVIQEQVQGLSAQLAAGSAWQADALKLDLEVAAMERELLAMQAERDMAAQQINALLHLVPELPLPPPPRELAPPPPLEASINASINASIDASNNASIDALQAEALRQRPELAAMNARAEGAQAAIRLAERGFYPDARVMGTYTTMNMETEHQLMVGVELNVPISRAPRRAAVAQAQARLQGARAEQADLADTIRQEVAQALRRDAQAAAVLALYQGRILPTAEQRAQAVLAGLASGRVMYTDVLEAERELEMARLEYEKALADAHRRRAELERALGVVPAVGALGDLGDKGGSR